jgi:hypothetical protein
MVSEDVAISNSSSHTSPLGICWFIYGFLRLAFAVWLMFFNSTATLMFGALLARVPDPFTLMDSFHLLYGLLIVFCAVGGILGLLAGVALMAGRAAGRMIAVVAAFFSVSDLPIGTALGTYTLVVFLRSNVRLSEHGAREAGWNPQLARR